MSYEKEVEMDGERKTVTS